MNFWDGAENLEVIFSIFGWSLISVAVFVRQLINSKKVAAKTVGQNATSKKYNEINLKSCLTGILFSVVAVVLYKMYLFWIYKLIFSGSIPSYSTALYSLCLLPLPVGILGSLIGFAIGKRDL